MKLSRTEIEQVLQALQSEGPEPARPGRHLHVVGERTRKRPAPSARDVDRVREICGIIAAMPDVRPDRLSELMRAVEHGEYDPAAIEVAEKMLGRIMADKLK